MAEPATAPATVVDLPARRAPLVAAFVALRPRQWTKNLLLFAGIVFAAKLGDPARWSAALTAFGEATEMSARSGNRRRHALALWKSGDVRRHQLGNLDDARADWRRIRSPSSSHYVLPVQIELRIELDIFLNQTGITAPVPGEVASVSEREGVARCVNQAAVQPPPCPPPERGRDRMITFRDKQNDRRTPRLQQAPPDRIVRKGPE